MFTKLGVIIIAVIVLVGLTGSGLYGIFSSRNQVKQSNQDSSINTENSAEAGFEVAKSWILNNSPTYIFDGSNLKHLESVVLNCVDCYGYVFTFESAHAGFGDRTGQILAQVITPHTINIAIKEGTIIQAVINETYDEIRQEMIEIKAESESALPQPE
ncbi:MAG: hypothetical protein Q7R86_00340 [bacterium]|nr:hypothetical protein [bacterium]